MKKSRSRSGRRSTGSTPKRVPLSTLSITMAFVATLVFELVSQSQFIGKILFSIDMTMFYLPYASFVPDGVSMALFFSFEIMIINIVLFLVALYVVPGIAPGSKRLLPATCRVRNPHDENMARDAGAVSSPSGQILHWS